MLFVSAPVSRYFVLDLLPGRSFVGHVATRGHDVYLLDFGEPDTATRFADLDYYVNGVIRRAMRRITTLTGVPSRPWWATASAGPCAAVRMPPSGLGLKLVLLTTTIDGDVKGGIPWVAQCLGADGESYEDPRLVPAATVKSWFEMLAPGSNSALGRSADLWARLDLPTDRLRDVQTMATWVDDVPAASGRLLSELFDKFGPGRNGLMRGTADINGVTIDPGTLTMPVLSVSAERDTIAPAEGVDAITEARAARTGPSTTRRTCGDRGRTNGGAPVGHHRRVPAIGRLVELRMSPPAPKSPRPSVQRPPNPHHDVGTGEPLLLIMGLGGNCDMWGPLLPHLENRRTIAFDAPVRAGPDSHLARVGPGARGHRSHVLGHYGIATSDVLGFSYGGAIAQQLAVQHPALVRASCSLRRPWARGASPEARSRRGSSAVHCATTARTCSRRRLPVYGGRVGRDPQVRSRMAKGRSAHPPSHTATRSS